MNEDYTQPFCIIGSRGRFATCFEDRGYLPALEPPPSEALVEPSVPKAGGGYSQLLREMNQLKGTLNFLEGKINKLEERLKKRRKGLGVIPPLYIKKE